MTQQLDDILLLEDNALLLDSMINSLPKDVSYAAITSGKQLQDHLESGSRAKLYFFDDTMPSVNTGLTQPSFIEHHQLLTSHDLAARVFYHGSAISDETKQYCNGSGVMQVSRHNISEVIESHRNLLRQ